MAVIGIFDSGVGGLSVFREIKKLLPCASYVYYGDNANCPYGPKGPNFIVKRSMEIAEYLVFQKNVDVIVVACNTATSYSLECLRERYNIPIIGIVPGIKPAAAATKTGVIGVLATFGTLNAPLYNKIRDTWGADVKVIEHIGQGFVELVENLEISGINVETVVEKSIQPLVKGGADKLVLGCTHYPFLKETIEKVANRIKPKSTLSIEVYDPAPAIARHLVNVLNEYDIKTDEDCPIVEMIASGNDVVLNKLYNMFLK